jgi:catechol 2,3-dioxygenase-like lactoylglutathione lyase family enzyme
MSTTILRSATYFPVPDVDATGSYYRRVLGFRCEYAAGDPPEFAIYSRDACVVMLRRAGTGSVLVPNEKQGGTWDVFCWVADVDAIHHELVAHGAEIVYPPTLQPYGMRELAVRDPDGYVLGFGSEVAVG